MWQAQLLNSVVETWENGIKRGGAFQYCHSPSLNDPQNTPNFKQFSQKMFLSFCRTLICGIEVLKATIYVWIRTSVSADASTTSPAARPLWPQEQRPLRATGSSSRSWPETKIPGLTTVKIPLQPLLSIATKKDRKQGTTSAFASADFARLLRNVNINKVWFLQPQNGHFEPAAPLLGQCGDRTWSGGPLWSSGRPASSPVSGQRPSGYRPRRPWRRRLGFAVKKGDFSSRFQLKSQKTSIAILHPKGQRRRGLRWMRVFRQPCDCDTLERGRRGWGNN